MTKEELLLLLARSDRAVERAVLVIQSRQTADERSTRQTLHTNGRGWNAHDAKQGAYWAWWLNKGNHLSGRFLSKARATVGHYWRQLLEAAEEKASAATGITEWRDRVPQSARNLQEIHCTGPMMMRLMLRKHDPFNTNPYPNGIESILKALG